MIKFIFLYEIQQYRWQEISNGKVGEQDRVNDFQVFKL
jgi:hypothetical protein